MLRDKQWTRRRFLSQVITASTSAMAIPYLVPASALGRRAAWRRANG